jgi:hypothetical protein
MTDVTPDLIFQVANSFMAANNLFIATEIEIFEALADSPTTLDALPQRRAIPCRALGIVADAMVALGFPDRRPSVAWRPVWHAPPASQRRKLRKCTEQCSKTTAR